jgi:hypothetical protein
VFGGPVELIEQGRTGWARALLQRQESRLTGERPGAIAAVPRGNMKL